tara:strand:+ start:539 stop:1639 length:1101 start_codon:yes stop_codon:yes gene_type:complete
MKVKFADLSVVHNFLRKKFISSFKTSLKNSDFIGGKNVSKFEKNFAKINNSKFCTSVANGTDALFVSLKTLGIKKNDEVIVPAHSWISTSEVISLAGGKVKFCDVSAKTFNIDPKQIEKMISNKTVGIIAVHLYGNPADMLSIKKIAKKYKLWIIEDCAQAHFAQINKKKIGNFGDMAAFSFYPGKNLGALGDAGAIVTNNKKHYEFAYMFARHGSKIKHKHKFEGINSRLDSVQAEFLNIKLSNFKKIQSLRDRNSIYYNDYIKNKLIEKPHINKNFKHAWHQYVIKSKYRDQLKKYLYEKGIETRIVYPVSLPFLEPYKYLGHKETDFPNAFDNQNKILSLPNDPSLKRDKIFYIIKQINNFKI